MSPRDLAKTYAKDYRLFDGRFFSPDPLKPGPGDRVGIVLMVPGAPEKKEDVYPYLYHRLMLPPGARSGWRLWIKHVHSRLSARMLSRQVISEYSAIGGGRSINRLNAEQSVDLKSRLLTEAELPENVNFSTYLASPFGTPSMSQAAREMERDGVTHVLLLPLFPQYAAGTTGRALASWEALIKTRAFAARPTTAVWQFGNRDKYQDALNDRIEQALQRFPRHIRKEVEILFAAHGVPAPSQDHSRDPYCCLVHQTVEGVMARRGNDRTFSLSFVRSRAWGDQVSIDLQERIRKMARAGTRAVVVVPVDHVSEQFDTAFLLDVRMRSVAEEAGIGHYHVASGLNCHPLFIECLSDLVSESVSCAESKERTIPTESLGECPRKTWDVPSTHRDSATDARCHICPLSESGR